MKTQPQRRLWFALLALALFVPVDALILRALTQDTIEKRAAAWAKSLSDEDRSHYIRNGDLPPAYFAALKRSLRLPNGIARVYQDKVLDYRRAHPSLPEDQDRFLSKWMDDIVNGRMFRTDRFPLPKSELMALKTEIDRLFPNREDRLALFYIAWPTGRTGKEPLFNRTVAWVLGKLPSATVQASYVDEGDCRCSYLADDCTTGHCCDSFVCTPVYPEKFQPACGPGNQWVCDGLCDGIPR